MDSAIKPLADHTFCALDLETTGTNPFFHKIVEVGIVRFTLDTELDTYSTLINPETSIPEDVTIIHGITDNMVADSPYISDILQEVKDFMNGSLMVAHNPSFDLGFLDWVYRQHGSEPPRLLAVDTVRMARRTFPYLENHKLETIKNYFNFDGQSHRALSDALCCMKIFRLMVACIDPDFVWTLSDLIRFHGHLIKPGIKHKNKIRSSQKQGLIVGKRVSIRYSDNHGKVTNRDILPLEFIKYGKKNYLLAQCYLRNERRYFKLENILEVMQERVN